MAKSRNKRSQPTQKAETVSKTRTARRREEKRKQEQRRRLFVYLLAVVAVAVVAVIVFVLVNQPAEAPIPDGTVERYEGIPQAKNDDGFYFMGNPDAPVRVVEYSSFGCPACREFYDSAGDDIVELVREGVITYTFIPRYTVGIQNTRGAARAAFCAGEQGRFFEFHDALFEWVELYGNTAFSTNRFITGAENLDLDSGAMRSCLSGGAATQHVERSDQVAEAVGIGGVPYTTVNGVEVASNADTLVQEVRRAQGNQPAVPLNPDDAPSPEVTPEVTPEATPESESTPEVTAEAASPEGEATAEATPEMTPEATEPTSSS